MIKAKRQRELQSGLEGVRAPSSVDNGSLKNVGANLEVTGNMGVFGAPRRPGWHVKKMGERVD